MRMKITELKVKLSGKTREELLALICQLYRNSKQCQSILDMEFGGQDARNEVLNKCKEQIKHFFQLEYYSLRSAKKVISDFKKTKPDVQAYADLLLYYVECGLDFTNTYGDIDETFYNSVENVFAKFVEILNMQEDASLYLFFQERIEAARNNWQHIGWGFTDEMDELHREINWLV